MSIHLDIGVIFNLRDQTDNVSCSVFPFSENLADLLTVAGSGTRLKILFLLAQDSELCVCDLADVTGTTVSAISHQLSKLRAHGLIGKRRAGQTIFYRLLDTPFAGFLRHLFELED